MKSVPGIGLEPIGRSGLDCGRTGFVTAQSVRRESSGFTAPAA